MRRTRAHTRTRTAQPLGAAFTLVELVIVASVLMLALILFSRTMDSAVTLGGVNRETRLATNGARDMIERLQGTDDFSLVFARFNDDPDDDPGLPGSAPGSGFAVNGLSAADDDPDGLVGEIRFPSAPGPSGLELHEDLIDEDLGMPRDLNGDGEIDAGDYADEYVLLPVHLVIRWKGKSGVRELEIQTLLADR